MQPESGVGKLSFNDFKAEVLSDYRMAFLSRQLSILGRKEVLTGKAKFGIFGDGKELVQIAIAKNFLKGDWRSGYYRDQTLMLATGIIKPVDFFIQLYGVANAELNPGNGGRSFNNHYATPNIDNSGNWINLTEIKNSAADLSPTAAQMPHSLGLGLASKLVRENSHYKKFAQNFSVNGNEVVHVTIGDASTSEGHFFETMNSAGVMQIPMAVSVFDDGYGISVEKEVQTIKASISEALSGFKKNSDSNGILIFKCPGWDYVQLCKTYQHGIATCREKHVPVLFHIEGLTQPQGHSTSGSHERYKSPERLQWEAKHDPMDKMKAWLTDKNLATSNELHKIEQEAVKIALEAKEQAWGIFQAPIRKERHEILEIINNKKCVCSGGLNGKIERIASNLAEIKNPIRKDNFSTVKKILRNLCSACTNEQGVKINLMNWLNENFVSKYEKYSASLHNETDKSSINITPVAPVYPNEISQVPGRELLRDNFDKLFEKHPKLLIFGEDVGKIGGVNQTYEGLQEKYGKHRIFDTGIRETSIVGKGIGLAMRGFRPIAEIQYFDYILYALQTISDDLATLHWRTAGKQIAPLIISTRGHRLEGIWHSGSPLSMVINSIRGVFVCVPRDMTRAAGFYNTLLNGNDPALVIEPLNGYRLREQKPSNLGDFMIPLGVPEILTEGNDVTLVTYGSCVRIAHDAIKQLQEFDISVELIDVQTLLPFDINEVILESLKKTNKILFFDEDVPGGATAFMMQKVIEGQQGFNYLETAPKTLTAMDHRPAYSTDGDYFSNPNAEDVFDAVYELMSQVNPEKYKPIYTL